MKKILGILWEWFEEYPAIITMGIFIVVFSIMIMLIATPGSASSPAVKTRTCGYCHRSYDATDDTGNYKNIFRTGMCNKCYADYKYVSDLVN